MHVVTTTRFTDLDGCADSCSIQCDTEQTPGRHQGCSIIMHMETKGKTKQKSTESLRVLIRSSLGVLGRCQESSCIPPRWRMKGPPKRSSAGAAHSPALPARAPAGCPVAPAISLAHRRMRQVLFLPACS